jgi:predicted ribonuclease YlaK
MDARPAPLVDAEVALQRSALEDLVADLQACVERLSATGGTIFVLDTNILLQYEEPSKVPWRDVLAVRSVRLIVPLRVVEELDAKKYSGSKRLADRARAFLPTLEALVGPDGSPGPIADGVTIEVPVEPGSRWRPADADEEILAFCAELPQVLGAPATLVTADTAMRLRAGAQGTPVVVPPDHYRRGAGASR